MLLLQRLTLDHQVLQELLQLVEDRNRHLVLHRLLLRSLALPKQTICRGGKQTGTELKWTQIQTLGSLHATSEEVSLFLLNYSRDFLFIIPFKRS